MRLILTGPIDVSKCVAKWNYGSNASQLFSKMEVFIYQLDFYGNIVPGKFQFDAEIGEKGTNLSIPLADLIFEEFSPGIQVLSFSASESGNFLLMIYNAKHNTKISNMPYEFTVFVGYCDGLNSIIHETGLNHSIAGEDARFSVYLKDKYLYPSPVEMSMRQVQITRKVDSTSVLPTIYSLESLNGSRSPWHMNYDAMNQFEVAPIPSVGQNNGSAGISQVVSHAYDVVYTPERSGVYEISILCGNIPLNGEVIHFKRKFKQIQQCSLTR